MIIGYLDPWRNIPKRRCRGAAPLGHGLPAAGDGTIGAGINGADLKSHQNIEGLGFRVCKI